MAGVVAAVIGSVSDGVVDGAMGAGFLTVAVALGVLGLGSVGGADWDGVSD